MTERRNLDLPDDVIIAHAIENGWRQDIEVDKGFGGKWTGWTYETAGGSHGIPVSPSGFRTDRRYVDGEMREITRPHGWADVMRARFDHNDLCGECGRWIEYNVDHSDPDLTLPQQEFCDRCRFWLHRVSGKPDQQGRRTGANFVAMSSLGYPGPDKRPTYFGVGTAASPSSHNGFGGQWFVVAFTDDRTIETCDLWCGGGIPERFRDRLPVNATLRYGRLTDP